MSAREASCSCRTALPVALPMSPSLVGASFYHFVAAFEFDAQGIAAITSSNGIAAVVGAL